MSVVTVKKSSFFKMTKQGEYGTYLDLKCGFSKPIPFVIRSIPTLFGSTKTMEATDLRADVILDRNRRFSCTTAFSFSPSSCLQFLTVIWVDKNDGSNLFTRRCHPGLKPPV